MKCPYCGEQIADNSKICEFCGKEIFREKQTSFKIVILLLCLFFAAGYTFCYITKSVNPHVLDAFEKADLSLRVSMYNNEEYSYMTYRKFARLNDEVPEKTGALMAQVDSIKMISDELFNYIEDFKIAVAFLADGVQYEPGFTHVVNKTDFESVARYAYQPNKDTPSKTNAEVLQEKIATYREQLMDIQHYSARARNGKPGEIIRGLFPTDSTALDDGTVVSWEKYMFDDMPIGAGIVMLDYYQSNIRYYEYSTVTRFSYRIQQ